MSSNTEKMSHLRENLAKGVPHSSDQPAASNPRIVSSSDKDQRSTEQRYREELLAEPWIARNGHSLTFVGLMSFTILLFYRPYEFSGSLLWLNSMVFPIAIGTLAIYVPTQFYVENRPTIWTTEVKLLLAFIGLALITVPISKNPAESLSQVQDGLSRIVLIFLIFVNALRTKKRWNFLAFTLVGVGVMLSYQTIKLYRTGVFNTEGYRVSLDAGMLGNPNEMALFLLLLMPIAITLGLSSQKQLAKVAFLLIGALLAIAVLLTQSRGGFLGLTTIAGIFIWKLGKANRIKTFVLVGVISLGIIAFAPGNYGVRILSIFDSSLDPNGSSSERGDALRRSILVSLRNPQGVGIGNSPAFGPRGLQTHNAFTQVSSELGFVGLAIYLALLFASINKLYKIEKLTRQCHNEESKWYHLTSIGIQASIGGFMVTSFFGSVAYQWYIYYVIILAIGLRRLYTLRLGQSPEKR
ncbi:MAG: O-antigen ligase family protein [Acidobacteria bacterium]|nr:O-antigen ligase family protein [Acidobacteriota bacterium]